MSRVALIGPADRDEIVRMAIRVEERSAEPVVVDSRSDPAIVLGSDEETACGQDLRDVTAVYVADLGLRAAVVQRADGSVDDSASRRARDSSQRHLAAWNALLERLGSHARIVNPPHTHDLHALKPWEMASYARLGLPTPHTFSTSDPRALLAMGVGGTATSTGRLTDSPTGLITKGMVGGYGYTRAFAPPATEDAARQQLSSQPLMIQERVDGDNVRAFVLDGRVLGAAEILSADPGEVDSRRGDKRVRRIELPTPVWHTAVAAAQHWGLPFCAVDFMRDGASGRYVLLECNSSPFFVNFERATGLDISSKLADYLLSRRRTA